MSSGYLRVTYSNSLRIDRTFVECSRSFRLGDIRLCERRRALGYLEEQIFLWKFQTSMKKEEEETKKSSLLIGPLLTRQRVYRIRVIRCKDAYAKKDVMRRLVPKEHRGLFHMPRILEPLREG